MSKSRFFYDCTVSPSSRYIRELYFVSLYFWFMTVIYKHRCEEVKPPTLFVFITQHLTRS